MELISLITRYSTKGELRVSPNNIQEIVIVNIAGKYYKVQLTLTSGRTYFLADSQGNDVFDSKPEATSVLMGLKNFVEGIDSEELDPVFDSGNFTDDVLYIYTIDGGQFLGNIPAETIDGGAF